MIRRPALDSARARTDCPRAATSLDHSLVKCRNNRRSFAEFTLAEQDVTRERMLKFVATDARGCSMPSIAAGHLRDRSRGF